MTKKKSIFSDQRFIVLLVIVALVLIYMIFSPEFRKYSSILSMLDFSYYDVLMAIGVTFPLITGGVDLSIGTGMVCYALCAGRLIRDFNCPVLVAMLICVLFGTVVGFVNGNLIGVMGLPPFLGNSLYLHDNPRHKLHGNGYAVAHKQAARRMVPLHLQADLRYWKECA